MGIDREKARAFDRVGPYFDAAEIQPLSALVPVVVSRALDPTTSEVYQMDGNGKPTTTDVAMHSHDARTGGLRSNVMCTLNGADRPDTLLLDPFPPYRIIYTHHQRSASVRHNTAWVSTTRSFRMRPWATCGRP